MELWAAAIKKKRLVSVAVPPAPVMVPSQRPLAPNVASITSIANDKGDNEIILGAVRRSPGFCAHMIRGRYAILSYQLGNISGLLQL